MSVEKQLEDIKNLCMLNYLEIQQLKGASPKPSNAEFYNGIEHWKDYIRLLEVKNRELFKTLSEIRSDNKIEP